MTKFLYNKNLKKLAANLRNNSTLAETLLWNELKGKKMMGYDFHRQKPLYNYIVDFYCNKLMLAIEIDGYSHDADDAYEADQQRQKMLESNGIHFLRFEDKEVKQSMDNVLRTIEGWIEAKTHP